MARTGLRMMPTFPSSPLKFRTVSFPQYGFKADFQTVPFSPSASLPHPSSLLPPFVLAAFSVSSPLGVGDAALLKHHHASGSSTLPQGPSLRCGFFCPTPSSLIRPHPPHWQAHRDFTVQQLIRHALAVRFRL